MPNIGFIILRHVNNPETNMYWQNCYKCIRTYYPDHPILIIDDNSKYEYITHIPTYKTAVIRSEYPGRGELLPYYYYIHYKFADTAVIIHDSVFINKHIDLNVDKYKILWYFEHDWDNIPDETKLIEQFNDPQLTDFYTNKSLWKGCFGCMSVITHDYLISVNSTYEIRKLLPCVLNRSNRSSFERVIACLLQKKAPLKTMFGNIHTYCRWGVKFNEKKHMDHLPFIKVWTGR